MSKIKCTYRDCFKHFDTKEKMIRHKVKEPDHSYCKVCDVDCENDMLYFIHQLASPAHNCCPVCAIEFKNVNTRDQHVESQHRADSNIPCSGCQIRFSSGYALMRHIEQDECPIIRVQDFQEQRAERQIQKDAWEAEADPFAITSSTCGRSVINTNDGSDLLDARLGEESVRSASNFTGGPDPLASPAQYQPLAPSQFSNDPTGKTPQPSILGAKMTSNLIDLNDPVRGMSAQNVDRRPWSFGDIAAQSQQYSDDPSIKGWINQVSNTAEHPSENASEVASTYDRKQPINVSSNTIAPSVQAQPNNDAPHQHITSMAAPSVISTTRLAIDKYWDPIRGAYNCPSTKCKGQFRNIETFRDHLLTSSHVGGQVTCPSCLKKFATAAAWVSHTESASKRCDIKNSFDYNHVMREITGGVLGTAGFNDNGSVRFVAPRIDEWNEE